MATETRETRIQPSSAAARMRRLRERRRQGEKVYAIPLDEHALAEFLIQSGRLSEAAALDPERVTEAVRVLVEESMQIV